jgi:hypothetical protein
MALSKREEDLRKIGMECACPGCKITLSFGDTAVVGYGKVFCSQGCLESDVALAKVADERYGGYAKESGAWAT